MRCPGCGQSNDADSNWCTECGLKLEIPVTPRRRCIVCQRDHCDHQQTNDKYDYCCKDLPAQYHTKEWNCASCGIVYGEIDRLNKIAEQMAELRKNSPFGIGPLLKESYKSRFKHGLKDGGFDTVPILLGDPWPQLHDTPKDMQYMPDDPMLTDTEKLFELDTSTRMLAMDDGNKIKNFSKGKPPKSQRTRALKGHMGQCKDSCFCRKGTKFRRGFYAGASDDLQLYSDGNKIGFKWGESGQDASDQIPEKGKRGILGDMIALIIFAVCALWMLSLW
jgi:hypothetical protein